MTACAITNRPSPRYCFWTDVLLRAHLLAMNDISINPPSVISSPVPEPAIL